RVEEPRVNKVIEPVIVGANFPKSVSNDDKDYVVDLGLLKNDPDAGGILRPSNPIYGELIVRALSERLEDDVPHDLQNKWLDGTGHEQPSQGIPGLLA
ncbi:MAG: ATP-binding protein, partial [Deltaproteobacteria bacterium]|nr:ATP-binding protein [Deltaproteobacteria bacterium]